MGASEAGGGKGGWWGQARLVGAGEANGGRKPPGQISSQQHYEEQELVFVMQVGRYSKDCGIPCVRFHDVRVHFA